MLKINKIWRATTSRESGLRGSFLALLVICTSLSYAQNDLTQTLRGRVLDAVTNAPIPSASIILSKKSGGTTSVIAKNEATEGVFRFEKIAVGRYDVSVRCLGFQSITLTDVIVETGKETIIELKMTASSTLLDSFEVRSTTADIAKIGLAQSVNMEVLQRLPATFSDVARMLTSVAGVSAENDAANHISVRGVTPNAIQWYLEGAEIVNPNHLSNAGTGNDRATQNGGGVSIFSTQVLERADFYKGSTPTGYGNALGGAIDVRFRKGNDDHQETTLGIGLIGLDAATEGVFSKNSKASYLINARYATVGLLSKLGVPLGDEASNYQDVSFKLNFPTQKMGEFAVFGMGGISENVFLHKKRDKWETQKDSQNITFTNRMGAIGASHSINLGNNTSWQTVVALSGLESRRLAMGLNSFEVTTNVVDFNAIHRKFFIKSQINQQYQIGVLSAGLVIKNEFVDNLNTYKYQNYAPYSDLSKGQGMWYMPFADFSSKIGSKWAYSIGVRGNYFSFNNKLSVEPTAMLQRKMGQNASIKLTYSRQSQLLTPPQYFRQNGTQYYYKDKDFVKSDNVNLIYTQRFSNNIQLSATAFGQFYQHIFVIDPQFPPRDYWSILDGFGGSDNFGGMAGTAQSIGIEASISQSNRNGWFWQVNTTLFDATYKDPNGNVRSMAYNSHYIFNGYIGKEWLLRGRKNRFMGVGSRTILRGGNYQYPNIYTAKSPEVATYFRTDLNVYVKRNRKKWSSTLQLDIQNVTNRENEQYYYFDSFKQKVAPQLQLGLLPNLSYKIAF